MVRESENLGSITMIDNSIKRFVKILKYLLIKFWHAALCWLLNLVNKLTL